jgi:hypothetical protein
MLVITVEDAYERLEKKAKELNDKVWGSYSDEDDSMEE